jgi:hypothetical protein
MQNSEFAKNASVFSGMDYTFPVLVLEETLKWTYNKSPGAETNFLLSHSEDNKRLMAIFHRNICDNRKQARRWHGHLLLACGAAGRLLASKWQPSGSSAAVHTRTHILFSITRIPKFIFVIYLDLVVVTLHEILSAQQQMEKCYACQCFAATDWAYVQSLESKDHIFYTNVNNRHGYCCV